MPDSVAARIFIIASLAIAIPSVIHTWIIPRFFDGYKTYIFLAAGTFFGGAGVAYVAFNDFRSEFISRLTGGLIYGATGGTTIFLAILFIILNTRGS